MPATPPDVPDWTSAVDVQNEITVHTSPTEPIYFTGTTKVYTSGAPTKTKVEVTSPAGQSVLSPATVVAASYRQRITTATHPYQLHGTTAVPTKYGVAIKARKTNDGVIYVGGSTVSIDSFPLDPGETISLPPFTPFGLVWVMGSHVGDTVSIVGL